MAITTFGDIGQRTAAFAMTDMLAHSIPVQVLAMFGQNRPIPANKAETVKFRRAIPFAPATTPLVEGVTPAARVVQFEDVQVTLQQYGDLTIITDKVADLSEDPVLSTATQLLGEQAGATLEQLVYNVVKGGTVVFYANGASRAAVNTTISLNKQRKVTRQLKAKKAKKFTRILSGSTSIGTTPIEAAYVAVAHTNLEADIRNMAGFVPTAEYGQRTVLCPQEIGSVEDVRYVLSPDLQAFADAGGTPGGTVESTSGSAADVYPILFFGEDAFGVTPLRSKMVDAKSNMPITPMVLNPGTPSKSDPLAQRGYVSWKAYFAALILNQEWMARLEVAASAL